MSKFKKKLKKAALAGIALYGASKMLGAQKTPATGEFEGPKQINKVKKSVCGRRGSLRPWGDRGAAINQSHDFRF